MVKFRPIVAIAVIASALFAHAANISGVQLINVDGDYSATPVYNATAAHNLSAPGWYAGLKLTWTSNAQRASNTQTKISDNIDATSVSFTGNATTGSGIVNTTTTRLFVQYLATTTWYFSVTPDMMKECAAQEKDYEVTLTIGDNEYTVVVPRTVTLVDDNGVQLYPLTEHLDITGETLEFSSGASFTYDGTEKTVAPTLTVNGLTATFDVDMENSTLSATEIGAYTVTVNGTGDFKGTATGTWEIVNTTGSLKGVAATTSAEAGSYADGTLTVTDTTALEFSEGAWTAALTLTWPMESSSPAIGNGHGHYVKPETMLMTIGEAVYIGREIVDSEAVYAKGKLEAEVKDGSYTYYSGLSRRTQNFSYLSSTTWTVALSPTVVEAALAEDKAVLEYTMRAGALVWGDSTEGDPDGVAFADYKIELSLENPIVFALGENETHDLGETVLTTTRIKLAPGASVTTTVQQTEGLIFIETPGYDVVWSENAGVYTYTTKFTHEHAWSFGVIDGTNLVATCGNDDCDKGGETMMWLQVDATEKVYDGNSMVRAARYDDNFTAVFPGVSASVTVNGADGPIKDAGTYTVVMNVTGLGDGETHTLSCTVTVSPVDITDATLVLTPASTTYNGEEQTVAPSITVNNLTATFDVAEGSVTSATEIGEYSVTVNGTGNFTGTASATWEIKNTTGAMGGVAAASAGYGDVENNILTVADTTVLEFSDGTWYAGLTLTWPVDAVDASISPARNGHAYYVKPDKMQLAVGENVYKGSDLVGEPVEYSDGVIMSDVANGTYWHLSGLSLSDVEFTRLSNTTWKVAITPAVIEAALAEHKTALEYTMNAGAFVWGDSTEGDLDGVAFADYAIALPLDEPVLFELGENETHDLGETVLTTTRIKLAPGASVTSSIAQTEEDAIFTEATGYEVERSESDGVYTYTARFTHQHNWSFGVVGGTNLVATCLNDDCDLNGEVRMWLHVDTTEKEYDEQSMTPAARYDDYFKSVFPGGSAPVTVNGVDGLIKDAGTYEVVMKVTGVGGDSEPYVLSKTVTINKKDISGAALVLTPASTTYNAAEQTVAPSVTVDGLAATIEVDTETSTTAATEIGEYTVTVNGTGNFTGTASATWTIANTTGEPTSVTASAAGSMTNVGNDFTLSDSSKLEYDPENKVWYPGITITWPMSKTDYAWYVVYTQQGSAKYVTEESARITTEDGVITNVTATGSYRTGAAASTSKDFTYLSTTTWKVPLTPEIIEAAIAEEKTSLTYTMNAGAIVWGNSTEGDTDGVAFADYTITIPLEGIKLYDENGKQVYPKTEGGPIEDIKDEIDTTPEVAEEVAESAKGKIDDLVSTVAASESPEQDVANWVGKMKSGYETPAEFYTALAESDYVTASFELGTETLITEDSEVEVAEFVSTDDGFTFEVKIDDGNIEAARVQAASIIQTATSLGGDGGFGSLAADRIKIVDGKITIIKDPNVDREFFKIVIKNDSAE